MLRYALIMILVLLTSISCGKGIGEMFSTEVSTHSTDLTVGSTVIPTKVNITTQPQVVTTAITPNATPTTSLAQTVTRWSTFTYTGSPVISIDYPAGWNVEVLDIGQNPDQLIWAQFYPPNDTKEGTFSFQVYRFEKRFDPRDELDKGWSEIPWYRPISVKEATGIMYIVRPAQQEFGLSSSYYSEKYKLQIYITPGLNIDETILQSPSITDAVSQNFGTYEHIVESLRLAEPN